MRPGAFVCSSTHSKGFFDDELSPHRSRQAYSPVLSLRNVSVTFGGVKALQDVSFEVLPGEVQCIAGENGSGKSTLIKVITGVYQPRRAAHSPFAGKSVDTMSPAQARAAASR